MSAAPEPLHVHVVIDALRHGGAETLLSDFAAGAPAAGLRLTVSFLDPDGDGPAADRLRRQGIEPVGLGVRGLVSPRGLRTVRRHVAALRPDLVHTHLNYADLAGGLAARSLGIPAVATIHVMAWERTPREWTKEALSSLVRRTCARRVVCVSESAREAFLAARWDRPSRVAVVHNGVLGAARPGAGAAVRRALGIAEDEVVLTMLSVLRAGKGHDVAVDAVRALEREEPRVRLLVAGAGPAHDEVARLVAPLGDRAILAGHRDDVMEVLDATDVLLHPTSVDAFPTALLEAAAASVPVVATAVGGIPEIVEDGRTGVLVEPPPRADAFA
ncbi:MAG TPA: glycosyltransferase family 4 protein, partial [Solirubrobacteraceae bacterium]|nr:glycosyltransferase family 4 protein [Solirubrobacteraceae bacterium]